MIATVSTWSVFFWTVTVFGAFVLYAVIAPLVYAVVSATLFCRKYYREHPEERWPDKRLVHLCMWRVR